MSDLETIQKIWEIWTEAFDKVDNEEKKEWFNNLIEELDNTEAINRLKKQWDSVSEEEKLKLYKRWAIKMSASLKKAPILTYYRAINNTRKKGDQKCRKDSTTWTNTLQISYRTMNIAKTWIPNKRKIN